MRTNKEILAVVNQMVSDGQISQDVAEKYFPELRESKDERIRKALISFLKSPFVNESITDEKVTPWIAWLEKQGGQKPAGVKPKFMVGDTIRLKNSNAEYIIESISDSHYYGKGFSISIIGGNRDYELVEQNPEECSEDNLPDFESYLCLMFQKFRTKGICTNGEIIDFVKEHSQKLKNTLCPTWSEEDETRLTNIIIMLKEGASLHFNKKDITKAVDWLKSLRPQSTWKPSDEQLDSLYDVLNPCDGLSREVLESLYVQLKELKGE